MTKSNHILIVDDNPVLSENLDMILRAEGYDTTRVSNGQDALDAIQTAQYQVVLLDNQLPDSEGIELIPLIREKDVNLPVIVITAFATVEVAVEALRLGADGFLLKPMDIDELLRSVSKATEKYRLEQKEKQQANQLQALYQAAVAITAELDLNRLLQLIIDLARELINASYGTIGVVDGKGNLTQLVTSGLSEAQKEVIAFPIPEDSLLGRLINYRKPMRLHNVDKLPVETGFLPNYPQINNQLGVPIVVHDRFLGNLFLTNKNVPFYQTGPDVFTQEDLQLINTLAAQAAVAIEKAHLFQAVQQLSITDELTGLYNRRHFDVRLAEEFRRARRYKHPLVVVMADLDGLKVANDLYGHAAGDRTLVYCANLLNEHIRKTDLAARYGGDEFAIILTETGLEGGLVVTNKMKETLESAHIHFENTTLQITASFGVAVLGNQSSPEEVIRQADKALYLAKERGKNQVCFLPE